MNASQKIINTYSKSLLESVKDKSFTSPESLNIGKITSTESNKVQSNIYTIAEELLLVRALLVSSKTTADFFKNPTYSENQKLNLILNIFPGLSISLQSFLKVLSERSHLYLIPEIYDDYTQVLANFRNSTIVTVSTAAILKENYGTLLLKSLKSLTNSKEVILKVIYNPKLLGGLIIEYNSKSIDASILKEFSLFFNEG